MFQSGCGRLLIAALGQDPPFRWPRRPLRRQIDDWRSRPSWEWEWPAYRSSWLCGWRGTPNIMQRAVILPYWLLTLATAILPALWFGRWRKAKKAAGRRGFEVVTGKVQEQQSQQGAQSYLRRNTIELCGLWEHLNNPAFNPIALDGIKKQVGLNSFILTAKQWIQKTGAIGIISKAGRYGGMLLPRLQSIAHPMGVPVFPGRPRDVAIGRPIEQQRNKEALWRESGLSECRVSRQGHEMGGRGGPPHFVASQ